MSPGDRELQKLTEVVGALKCETELPSSWTDYFDRHGTMPAAQNDRRRFPRSYLRVSAALGYRQSFPALPRSETWHKVYMKDVARGGVGYLHSEQLFPGEQMALVFPDGSLRTVEVVRCRRIDERCYEIGAIFISRFREADATEEASD